MIEFLRRLRQRKLVQWTLAYLAAAFTVIQVVDVVAERFDWAVAVMRYIILALAVGIFVAIAVTWYHGERGAQHVAGPELIIIALLLLVGGIVARYAGRELMPPVTSANVARTQVNRGADATTRRPAATGATATQPDSASRSAGIVAKSVAVLPFENLSGEAANAYFVAGMQELILTKLAYIGDLRVISRTSTMKYKSRPANLRHIAAELGVAAVLEGSVQKQGNRVLINVQLIDAASDSNIWAQTYERTLDDVFGVEGEVAGKIADALHAQLSPAQAAQLAAVPTTDKAAYDLFLHAEYQAGRGDVNYDTARWRAALPLYRQAVRKDPQFALAFARLSRVESLLAFWGGAGEDATQLGRQARADAEQALQLRPGFAAAQLALGYCDYYGRRNYAGALKAFRSVLANRPNDTEALAAQGYVLRRQGQFDAAIASFMQAVAVDPRNFEATYETGNTALIASRFAEAETWLQRALMLQPESSNARATYSRAIAYGSGDLSRALAVAQGDAPDLKVWRLQLLGYQRDFNSAIALLQGIPDTPDNFSPDNSKALQLAILYWQAGDRARARPLFAASLAQSRAALTEVQGHVLASLWNSLGYACFGTGDSARGLEAIARSEALLDAAPDAVSNPNNRLFDAAAYAMAGRADLTVPLLARTLDAPGIGRSYSPVLLWLDPAWDPIRKDPRFEALLQHYATYKPTPGPAPPRSSSLP